MAVRDRLKEYNRKRDFQKTIEPPGTSKNGSDAKRGGELLFTVQKHAATRLHFDLRLEWNGVLLSWAVTRGPSNAQTVKRLAVRTEDHPMDYAEFEGTIAKGNYGAGTVMLWDFGTWQPLSDVDEGLAKGILKFETFGSRMRGAWTLVRMKPKPTEKGGNWLLIKERDRFLENEDEDALVREYVSSVSTGRTMEEIAKGVKPKRKSKKTVASKIAFTLPTPKFVKPQLANNADSAPAGDDWLHETKYDGYRCLAALGKNGVRLYTRSGLDWTGRYANLPRAFSELRCKNALIDGEVIAAAKDTSSGFSALQRALESQLPVHFRAFDLLVLDGENLTPKPLVERKELLRALLKNLQEDSPIAYSEHVIGNGPAVFEAITKAGGEGTIAKRADAPYRHQRSTSWLKIKAKLREEFVIGGFSPSAKRGRPFASLLVGIHENGRLIYRGRVGSGFGEREFELLAPLIKKHIRKSSPFEEVPPDIARSAKWLDPKLVAEVSFAELTGDGNIRHGVFVGLREDKAPEFVTVENNSENSAEVAGIAISSGERIVFPKARLTKLAIAEYYEAAGKRMIETAGDRPVSLVRCPDGISGSCFFQRHVGDGFAKSVKAIDIEEKGGDTEPYLYVTSPSGLVGAAQMGTIEFHIWGCRIDAIEKPDRMVFDLDPDEALSFGDVKSAALDMRSLLAELGLDSAAMVTGGKGVHVVVPLRRTISWETMKTFSQTVAVLMAQREPKRFTATMSKAKRKGRIFIDWLRNERGSTSIAPWSIRAREGAPVAMPVDWDEMKKLKSANAFNVQQSLARLSQPPVAEPEASHLGKTVLSRLEQLIEE